MKYTLLVIICAIASLTSNAQSDDMFPEKNMMARFTARYALDETPLIKADTNMIAIWEMKEDKDPHNYFVMERYSSNVFVFTYMNRGGMNRTYEHVGMFFSKIAGVDFVNVECYDREHNTPGFFFAKVTEIDSRGWYMTLSLVTDTTLKNITSREKLREHIEKNMNNPAFFAKPAHMHKKLPLMYCK